MKEENFLIRLLKKIGTIKEYEISKKEMCEQAKQVCNKDCSSCAWGEEE